VQRVKQDGWEDYSGFPPTCTINSLWHIILYIRATGTTPYKVHTNISGRHTFLILGEHEEKTASLLLWYEVHPLPEQLEVTIIQRSISSNGSVLVEFAANRLDVEFQCSTRNAPFHHCKLMWTRI